MLFKDVSYESKDPKKSIPFYTLFVEQKKDIERLSTLYSINASFKLMHVDIADIRFQNIAYWLLVFSVLKHITLQWRVGIF